MKKMMFVVRKLVLAENVEAALRLEKKTKVHEVFIDDEWRKSSTDRVADAIGYRTIGEHDD